MNPALSDPLLKCRFLWIFHSQLLEDEAGLEERHHIIPREPASPSGAGAILLQHLPEFGAGLKSCQKSTWNLELG